MKIPVFALCLAALLAFSMSLYSHCQIPCGIYGDETRVTLMEEHIDTIEKSMKTIVKLSAEENPDWNQLVRWVVNKDEHARKLSDIVTYYFMAQRVAPPPVESAQKDPAYLEKIALLHGILVEAMKAKQTVDLSHCAALREKIHAFENLYFEKKANP
jgi:nickel superoxide dismutase